MKEFISGISLTIDWSKLTTANYWFSPSPFEDSGFWQEILIFLILLAIFTIIKIRQWNKKKDHESYKKLKIGLRKSTIFIEIFLSLWLFFRTQSIFTLSNRLIGASVILFWLIWIMWILYYRYKKMPSILQSELEYLRKKQYLPKSKAKNA